MQKFTGRVIAFATALALTLSIGAASLNGMCSRPGRNPLSLTCADDWDERTSRN